MDTWLTIVIVVLLLWAVGFLCFAWHRLANTYIACYCRDLSGRLAVDWQETVEITLLSFFYSR